MAHSTVLQVGQVYRSFEVISIDKMDSYNSIGILLRHKKCGMEIFQMFNDDEENLFSFGFKTPSENSSGVAHIIEHSVLCGSAHYPLKDTFIRLSNQSVKTFLNAMTFSDKTVYPASSVEEQDYFNLMAVYGDAVFFPLLTKETFMQEAHRFEVAKNGKLEIQGVVFNEMKSNYSSFESVAQEYIAQSLFPDCAYKYDSGGDPVVIPDLSYEDFVAFHKKYYHPANCRLFLYGNIPLEKQIDFINEKFLCHFDFDGKDKCTFDYNALCDMTKSSDFLCPKKLHFSGPLESDENDKDEVLLSWNLGESADCERYAECILLAEILMGHDASPINKALIDSALGEDLAPECGIQTDTRYLVFTCALRGVKKGDSEKVKQIVFDVLNDIATNGVNDDDLNSAILSVEFSNREIVRSQGPYSLTLMRRAYRTWLNGKSPCDAIMIYRYFVSVKEHILRDKNYIKQLIENLFLNNNNCAHITISHDANFNSRNDDYLAQKIAALKTNMQGNEWKAFLKETRREQKLLNEYQTSDESKQACALIPHIKPNQLVVPRMADKIEYDKIEGVRVFSCEQDVNGIVYVQVCFPIDVVPLVLLPYMTHFSVCMTNCGFGGKSWAESTALIANVLGGFASSIFTSSITKSLRKKANCEYLCSTNLTNALYNYDVCLGRPYLVLKIKMLNENIEKGIDLLFNFLETLQFNDKARIKDLTIEYKNDISSSVISAGYDYCVSRCSCNYTRSKALDEILNGFCQVNTAQKIASENIDTTVQRMEIIKSCLFNSGFIVNIVGEKDGIANTKTALYKNITQYKAHNFFAGTLKPPLEIKDEDIFKLTEIQGENAVFEQFIVNTQVGSAAKSFKCSSFGTKESVLEKIYGHYLSNNILWERIRTVGGAYGAFAFPNAIENTFVLFTLGDPNPFRTLKTFDDIIEKEFDSKISEEDFEKLITGCFSKEIELRSPSEKGILSFIRMLSGITNEELMTKIDLLLHSTLDEFNDLRKSFSKKIKASNSAIIFSKSKENSGKIIDLHL